MEPDVQAATPEESPADDVRRVTDLAAAVGRRLRDARDDFLKLLDEYQTPVWRLVRSRLLAAHMRAATDVVDDLSQEIWMRVWRALPDGCGDNFRAWLFSIAGKCVL